MTMSLKQQQQQQLSSIVHWQVHVVKKVFPTYRRGPKIIRLYANVTHIKT